MREMVDVSVIMPSLNVAEYIDECMESVRCQSLERIEILCVDAGSVDGTLEKLQEYAKRDSRIRLIQSEKKSYGYQVNIGIEKARGEYVAIVETDDYVSNNMMELLVKVAQKESLDYVKGNYNYFATYGGHRRFFPAYTWEKGSRYYDTVICPRSMPDLPLRDYNIWRGIYRRDFLIQNQIKCNESAGASYQDIGFLMQVYDKAEKCAYIEDILYYYQMNREGSSSCKLEALVNVENEFRRLKDYGLVALGKAFYIRLVYCLIPELDKLLRRLDFKIDERYIEKPSRWMIAELEPAISQGIIVDKDFPTDVWEKLQLISRDIKSYAKLLQEECKIEEEKKKKWIKPIENRAIVIFGSGVYGRRYLLCYENLGVNVLCICDNNPEKVGKMVEGYEVISPEQAHKEYPEAVFVIPDRPYKTEMMNQLKAIGAEYVVMTV